MKPKVGCAILTYQAEKHLEKCLPPLFKSPLKPKVLVIDSSSKDRTAALAAAMGAEVIVIPQAEFNHGRTREMARKKLGTEIVCMITQDAYMTDEHALTRLVEPLIEGKASVAYARQLPHKGAKFFEAFQRQFNYPIEGQLRTLNDAGRYGVYTFFCSNSCAAYDNKALDSVGGFEEVLLGEDTHAVAKLLHAGKAIAYAAEAHVYHSHDYGLTEEFKRNFDTGYARKSYGGLLAAGGSDAKRGRQYVKQMMLRLSKEAPHLIPYAIMHIGAKWAGYFLGRMSEHAPIWVKKRLSSQKYYW